MRIRLFWQLLAAFGLLIMFGIGGTVALIGVSFRRITTENIPVRLGAMERVWSAPLADYYLANGGSWAGVDRRVDAWLQAETWFPASSPGYIVLDRHGRPVAEGGPFEVRAVLPESTAVGVPIVVDGERIGTFALVPPPALHEHWGRGDNRGRWFHGPEDAPMVPQAPLAPDAPQSGQAPLPPNREDRLVRPAVEQQIGRAFWLVALAIGSVSLGLATLTSRRISAPLAALTEGARRVAARDLDVRAPSSSVREVDELARAFNQMAADLLREDQIRRGMTADIAHELRTPLTIIKGKLEGIIDGVYPGTAEHIEPVLEEAILLERLVEDLRVLSLAEARQLPLHPDVVPVDDLLEDTRRSFALEATRQGVTLEVDVAAGTPPVEVDPQRMQQVLGNLVANSLRHTDEGGRVDLRASPSGKAVHIAIADTGSGIPPEELPHIFDRFWRGDKARSRSGAGAGLGLAIARQLLEAQGGRISATSEPGEGTTITLELPIGANGGSSDA